MKFCCTAKVFEGRDDDMRIHISELQV